MSSLASYRSLARLHEGSRTDIFRGTDADGRSVVLKFLKRIHPRPEAIARLRHEYDTQRAVESRHVARALALETDQRRWAIVVEDFGGEPLSASIAADDLTLAERLDVALAIVAGLSDVHAQGVIHKDINPSNIVVNRETGEVKLIDFGISTALATETPAFSNRSPLVGTLRYISPEQTGRVSAPVDYRTDLYSLGVTLYELFTGAVPFEGQDSLELVHAHIARRPRAPHEESPPLPRVLSDIVMRLLEKSADARYQSTLGLRSDLQRCRDGLDDGGRIAAFPLAQDDRSERFQIPTRLYGRVADVQQLEEALERASSVGGEGGGAVLVTGAAGMGKSALVQQLYGSITERRGYFLTGKFEQFRRTPYAAFVAAFQGLVGELLGETETRLERLRGDLTRALGPNGRVVTDVIPRVELLIGPQPPLAELGPAENSNRFNSVFSTFIRFFAQPHHPLVLFLDDLQWADPASLTLLQSLVGDQRQCLLIVGAYRSDEVDTSHPLTSTVRRLEADGVPVSRIPLAPLDVADVVELLRDASGASEAQVTPLAELVVRNTGGNPLFVTELLRTLGRDRLIRLDRDAGRWTWDLANIGQVGVTQNVLDLMVTRLRRLAPQTLEALKLAACVGSTFDLGHLAKLREQSVDELWKDLFPAVAEGVLLATSELDAKVSDEDSPGRQCSFFHDRLQQAAYELIGSERRAAVHVQLGRILRDEAPERVFDIVGQLNRGLDLIVESGDRDELAHLNLEAATRALSTSAGGAALRFAEAGIRLLPVDPWSTQYELTFALHRAAGHAAFLVTDQDRATEIRELLLANAVTVLEKAEIYILAIRQLTDSTHYAEAVEAMHQGLALFDFSLPEGDLTASIGQAFGEIQGLLDGRSAADMADRPMMSDAETIAKTSLLLWAMAPAFYVSPLLYTIVIFEAMKLSIVHGNPPTLQSVYCFYGHLLGAMFGDPKGGYEFCRLGLELTERSGALQDQCQASFVISNFSLGWVEPMRNARAIAEAGIAAGIHGGEFRFAAYMLFYLGQNDLLIGEPLEQVMTDTAGQLAFSTKHKIQLTMDASQGVRVVANNLIGATADATTFECDGVDKATLLERCEANHSTLAVVFVTIMMAMVKTIYRDWDSALELSAKAAEGAQIIMGNIAVARNVQCRAIALAGALDTASEDTREELLAELDGACEQLGAWAEHCEANWGHGHALALAEAARIRGEVDTARVAYDRAMALSLANGYTQDHAVACELAGRFWGGQGRQELADTYLSQARYGFERWGAKRKVEMLEGEFPGLGGSERRSRRRAVSGAQTVTTHSIDDDGRGGSDLDLESVIKASQTISGEIVLDRLLGRLMEVVLESAGAQHGVLVVAEGRDLAVRAAASLVEEDVGEVVRTDVRLNVSLTSFPDVAAGVVNYAARTGETVLLNDALGEGAFTQTSYMVKNRPQSVLCLPIRNKGDQIGLLYLENRRIQGAFTESRLEVVSLLASQFGISFENARLYNEMEDLVARRTEQLRVKNEELETTLEDLRTTQDRLVHAEKMASLGTLTAGVAHELNNPLNFVNNFAEVGVELASDLQAWRRGDETLDDAEVGELVSDLSQNLEAIRDNGERAAGIVRSMLEHARGSGGGELQLTDLNALLRKYVKLAEFGLRSRHVSESALDVKIDLDEAIGEIPMLGQQLGRVIVNLLNNAVDSIDQRAMHSPEGFRGHVALTSRKEGDEAVLLVEDNGVGVPAELKMKVFEPFFTTKVGTKGTGLGLSLCYDIVVSGHGGSIEIGDSEAGGARFVVRLPAKMPVGA